MNFPLELKYTPEHEWVRFEGEYAFIGITEFAQRELGDIIYVEIDKSMGEIIPQSIPFGIVEAVKTVSDLFMPLTGTLCEINSELVDHPELLNTLPYEAWIIKVKIEDLSELETLLTPEGYQKLIGE